MMELERWNLLTPGDNVTRMGSLVRERVKTVLRDAGTGNVTSIVIDIDRETDMVLFRGNVT